MILVTGAAGYIGSHFAYDMLSRSKHLVLLDCFSNSFPSVFSFFENNFPDQVKCFSFNLDDSESLEKLFIDFDIDSVVHFAASKSLDSSYLEPVDFFHNNTVNSISLLQLSHKYGVQKFLFSSTAAVYSQKVNGEKYLESDLVNLNGSPYGLSKYFFESVLNNSYLAHSNMSIAILRYFNVAGAHRSGVLGDSPKDISKSLFNSLFRSVSEDTDFQVFGDDYATVDGSPVRDFVDVNDLIDSHILTLEYLSNSPGCFTWNIGSERGYSVLQVISCFEEVLGKPFKYRISHRRNGDIGYCVADSSKIRSEIGWVPKTSLFEMLLSSYLWFNR